MTRPELLARLTAESEPAYREFSLRLTPGADRMLGVRLPRLRKIASEIVREGGDVFSEKYDETFEETMLRGMVIGLTKGGPDGTLRRTAAFLPRIRNWAVCDSFCAGLKIAREYPDAVFAFIRLYLTSPAEFEVRFAVVMLLWYYVNQNSVGEILSLLADVRHQGYYAKTAVAWAVSVCYTASRDKTLALIHSGALESETHNLAIRKIIELRGTTNEDRDLLRGLKRKTEN